MCHDPLPPIVPACLSRSDSSTALSTAKVWLANKAGLPDQPVTSRLPHRVVLKREGTENQSSAARPEQMGGDHNLKTAFS